MSIHQTTKPIPTDEELMALPEDGYKRELIEGKIVMSPAGSEHGRQIMRFSYALGSHVYDNKLGELFDGQTGFRMSTGDVLSPDLSFVSTARLTGRSLETFFEGAPDVAVEFLSPSESKKYIEKKLELYFFNGTQLAWVIDTRKKVIAVHRDARSGKFLTAGEILTGEEVVRGFSIPVASVFSEIPR